MWIRARWKETTEMVRNTGGVEGVEVNRDICSCMYNLVSCLCQPINTWESLVVG